MGIVGQSKHSGDPINSTFLKTIRTLRIKSKRSGIIFCPHLFKAKSRANAGSKPFGYVAATKLRNIS